MKEALIAFVAALFIGAAINSLPGGLLGTAPPAKPDQIQPAEGASSAPSSTSAADSFSASTAPLPTTNDATFVSDVLAVKGTVFVDFYATWCGPCKQLAPIVEKLAGQFGNKVKFLKLDVDQSPKTAGQYGVNSIPTVIIFKDGKRVDSYTGLMPEADLAQAITKQL